MSILILDRVCAGFGEKQVLHSVSGTLGAGELIMLIGANASGKSTLIRAIAGTHPVTAGTITPRSRGAEGRNRPGLAVAPDALPLGLTGRHIMQLVLAALKTSRQDTALHYAEEVDLSARLDDALVTYSLGTKQKLSIALSLLGDPQLILLDESLNGLDLISVGKTLQFMQQRATSEGQTTLLVTHNLDLAQHYVHRAWLLQDGRLTREWTATDIRGMRQQGRLLSQDLLEFSASLVWPAANSIHSRAQSGTMPKATRSQRPYADPA